MKKIANYILSKIKRKPTPNVEIRMYEVYKDGTKKEVDMVATSENGIPTYKVKIEL
jgi:5-hydroxyisourate hydrolase-like protein (transthyretin family)